MSEDFCKKWLAPSLSLHSKICVTQEFGTIAMEFVGMNLINENYAHHHGSQHEKELYGQRLKDSFYVDTIAWKRNVLRRGLGVFLQAYNHLSHKL